MRVLALAGGVGGAKLADGLQQVLGSALTVIVNTGDDLELHGLYISPDLDTVMYTLAGVANADTGWGIAGDTFNNLEMLSRYGAEPWFRLGDRDLATHLMRTQMLRDGKTLTQVTSQLAGALGVPAKILPMSNERVGTMVDTDQGELAFQEYFVRRRWQPVVRGIRFDGIERAHPSAEVMDSLETAEAIIFCPSNPFVSIEPILSLRGIRERIEQASVPCLAVSPIVGGAALKGPAAKMFQELGIAPSALNVAAHYRGLIDRFVIDEVDSDQAESIGALGMQARVTGTVMHNAKDRAQLAREILDWVSL